MVYQDCVYTKKKNNTRQAHLKPTCIFINIFPCVSSLVILAFFFDNKLNKKIYFGHVISKTPFSISMFLFLQICYVFAFLWLIHFSFFFSLFYLTDLGIVYLNYTTKSRKKRKKTSIDLDFFGLKNNSLFI